MHKQCMLFFLIIGSTSYTEDIVSYTAREAQLIEHVKQSIMQAEIHKSKITGAILDIHGMTSHKVKHFLNNICSLPEITYLEIGVWKGATFTAALYGNQHAIKEAVAIDNWSEFDGPKEEFAKNCATFLKEVPFRFYAQDSFTIDRSTLFNQPIDVYFYDGHHSQEAQEKAFTYYDPLFAPVFIAIVDDWNCVEAQIGTRKAFEKLGYTILFERILPARYNGDTDQWWNGLYVAVVRR